MSILSPQERYNERRQLFEGSRSTYAAILGHSSMQPLYADSVPAHRSKVVKKWLKDNHMPVLEWPGNSPDLNPIENAWNYMKNKVQEAQPTNINSLKEVLTKLWIHMDAEYFKKLAESMSNRLRKVIQAKGTSQNISFCNKSL